MVNIRRSMKALVPLAALIACLVAPAFAQTTGNPTGAKTWIGHAQEIEEFIKSAEIASMKTTSVGVTHPSHALLVPGGPVTDIAWKPLKPGTYEGRFESYKSEIAAYELDKLLGLNMVPPTVEKRVNGDLGAAIFWVKGAQTFKELGGVPGQKGIQGPPAAHIAYFLKDMTKAKMFDDLIGNVDPNLGNWLLDTEWNIILIDHSRALTNTRELYHQLAYFDPDLWEKMKALDAASLTAAIGTWVDKGGIEAVLHRRDKMAQVIEKLKAQGQH